MAKFRVMSPYDSEVPRRGVLAVETRSSFVLMFDIVNNKKKNVCNSKHRYTVNHVWLYNKFLYTLAMLYISSFKSHFLFNRMMIKNSLAVIPKDAFAEVPSLRSL